MDNHARTHASSRELARITDTIRDTTRELLTKRPHGTLDTHGEDAHTPRARASSAVRPLTLHDDGMRQAEARGRCSTQQRPGTLIND